MDDCYLPWESRAPDWMEVPAGNMDLERLQREILIPVRAGEPMTYGPFLPGAPVLDEYGDPIDVDPDDVELILVEGTYSQHPSLADQVLCLPPGPFSRGGNHLVQPLFFHPNAPLLCISRFYLIIIPGENE